MNKKSTPYGIIDHKSIPGRVDRLFRISLKALVFNDKNEVLLVKETGRTEWDIPGGGMDHGESVKSALQRELKEEVNLNGNFTYQVISVENPKYVESINIWQMRIIFAVWPTNNTFSTGEDGDEVKFVSVESLKRSESLYEQIYAENAEFAIKLRDDTRN